MRGALERDDAKCKTGFLTIWVLTPQRPGMPAQDTVARANPQARILQ
jgi:hypothetical protein